MNLEESLNISRLPNVVEGRILEMARGKKSVDKLVKGINQVTAHVLHPGRIAGNHYHEKKKEKMYILFGSIIVILENLATKEQYQREIYAGEGFTLVPGIAHTITNLSDTMPAVYIEASTLAFDPEDNKKDVYPYEVLALKNTS